MAPGTAAKDTTPAPFHRLRGALIAASACTAGLAGPVFPQSAFGMPADCPGKPRFEAAPCPILPGVKALATARCGRFIVPENRARPNGRTLRLPVAILPSLSKRPAPDPIVYLSGGPGGIAINEADLLVAAGLNKERDVVILNQRGAYLSKPALTCPSFDNFTHELLGFRFYSAATRRAHLAATEACHRRLTALWVDLNAYNTTENAADFADLRRALNYSRWNVVGVSYGTDLAQALMRDHPAGIRSVVLDSTLPVNVTLAGYWTATREGFDALFKACAAQATCDRANPHLMATLTDLVNTLQAKPITVAIKDPATREESTVVIDGGALIDWLRNQSYDAPALRRAPALITQLSHGDKKAIEEIALDRARSAPPFIPETPAVSYGLAFGVVCREQNPPGPDNAIGEAGRAAFPAFPASIRDQAVGGWAYANDDCREVWKVPIAPPESRRPVVSPIPTLLISGGWDAVTSPEWTKAVAAGLSNATIITIPGAGHFVSPQSPCAQAVIASFLEYPLSPKTSCVNALKSPDFAP
jgi:pimeloyl-ACP methyl ester carboxylesterase